MVSALLGFVLPLTYCLNLLLNRVLSPARHKDGERQGLDMCELGAGAYPELTPTPRITSARAASSRYSLECPTFAAVLASAWKADTSTGTVLASAGRPIDKK